MKIDHKKNRFVLPTLLVPIFILAISCDKVKDMVSSNWGAKSNSKTTMDSQPTTSTKENVSLDKDSFYEATKSLYKKDYDTALQLAEKAGKSQPNDYICLYVKAQAQSMKGDTLGALKTLDEALRNGFNNKEILTTDIHLAEIRKMDAFAELLGKYGIINKSQGGLKNKPINSDENSIKAGDVEIRFK